MKYSECNAREKKAWTNIKNAASDYIFSLMNGCFDNSEDSDDYKRFKAELEDLESLITCVYHEATNNIYTSDGGCFFGKAAENAIRDIRFCGKEFLMKVTTFYCKKFQKEALAEI